ncbi:MAG TPA: carbon-nitrogen hydrolase family protein [Nocardioidaceae bacterium]|nr:carbon-nitrogen hydrolase family protein [Nocardioidaceae bacterium]
MRVAALQFAATTDVGDNIATIGGLIEQAPDADLVVAPEAAMHDFGKPDLPLGPVAQDVDGPFVAALAARARAIRATIVAGMFEKSADENRPYNTLVALGPDGDLLATYRKVHLYDSFGYRESDRLLPGDPDPVTLKVGDLVVGLMTCYDLRFPEYARLLVDAGADALAVPAAWVRGPLKEDHWETLLRARAIEHTAYVIAAAQTGPAYSGSSMVVDPMGVAIARLGDETGVATADVTLDRLREVRQRNPSLANRRLPAVR